MPRTLHDLAGYPVYTAGWALAPRSIGTIAAMYLAARMGMQVDQRKIMAVGLVILGWALWVMSTWTPDVTEHELWFALIAQGFAVGLVFNPMTVMAYTTLSTQLRGEGTALQSLARNIGPAIGISVTAFTLSRQEQVNHADIAAVITPFHRVLQAGNAVSHILDPATRNGAALLDRIVNQQAAIIAYNNDFRLMTLTVVPPMPLLLLMRRHQRPAAAAVGD